MPGEISPSCFCSFLLVPLLLTTAPQEKVIGRLTKAKESTLDYRLNRADAPKRIRPNPISLRGWTSLIKEHEDNSPALVAIKEFPAVHCPRIDRRGSRGVYTGPYCGSRRCTTEVVGGPTAIFLQLCTGKWDSVSGIFTYLSPIQFYRLQYSTWPYLLCRPHAYGHWFPGCLTDPLPRCYRAMRCYRASFVRHIILGVCWASGTV